MADEIRVTFPPPDNPIRVIFPDTSPLVVKVPGDPLPPAVPEPAGESPIILTASQAIGGHRGISISSTGLAIYADKDSAPNCIGISTGAAEAGASLNIQTSGELTETGWAWIPGEPVFLGTGGTLTQEAPGSGSLVVIGTATGATSLLINVEQPIIL